ncbi:MAG: UvrD-helicase domain-containing protein [Acidimicrobiales bacterium]
MSALRPTVEQRAILEATATGQTVAISAGAGTGKTSTLRMIADQRPDQRMLYLAFNKAIQVEAEASFPSNVVCKTAHSLAYREFGAPMRLRLNGPRRTARQNAQALRIAAAFGLDDKTIFGPAALATMAMHTVARFCRSADPKITARHFEAPEGVDLARTAGLSKRVVSLAAKAWEDLTAATGGRLKPTHDTYLKCWQLSKPKLLGFDVILYDECQDADPCIAAVVGHQDHAQLVAVGDAAQAIYGWRGAGDFLSRANAAHRLRLTQSWRFGSAVAEQANVWLGVIGTDMRVVGSPSHQSRLEALERPDTILCRSNAGTIDALLDAHDTGTKAHLVGGGKEMLALARAAERMMDGQPSGHPELVAFKDWAAVRDYAESDPSGSDLAVAVRMIERYGPVGVVRAIEAAVPAGSAELVVSTAHKAKGLEWPRVQIGSDFRQPLDKRTLQPLPIPRAEAMLAYVSVTRAMEILDTGGLAWIHPHLEALASTGTAVDSKTIRQPDLPCSDSGVHLPAADDTAPRCTSPSRGEEVVASTPPASTEEALAVAGVILGQFVGVDGEKGTWRVAGVGRDGSLTCFGGPSKQWRSFMPEWCYPAERTGRDGKSRPGRLPSDRRGLRAAWAAEHGRAHIDQSPSIHGMDT